LNIIRIIETRLSPIDGNLLYDGMLHAGIFRLIASSGTYSQELCRFLMNVPWYRDNYHHQGECMMDFVTGAYKSGRIDTLAHVFSIVDGNVLFLFNNDNFFESAFSKIICSQATLANRHAMVEQLLRYFPQKTHAKCVYWYYAITRAARKGLDVRAIAEFIEKYLGVDCENYRKHVLQLIIALLTADFPVESLVVLYKHGDAQAAARIFDALVLPTILNRKSMAKEWITKFMKEMDTNFDPCDAEHIGFCNHVFQSIGVCDTNHCVHTLLVSIIKAGCMRILQRCADVGLITQDVVHYKNYLLIRGAKRNVRGFVIKCCMQNNINVVDKMPSGTHQQRKRQRLNTFKMSVVS
jgi:hypothetical protein